tara:strand:- start:1143 stop:1520 length:378 start_codon:yes stop_codon:yes gene_type:complete
MKEIFSKNAPNPIGPYSQAVKHGNMIFISGQIAIDSITQEIKNDNIASETTLVMENIKSILKELRCDMNTIVKCSIFLSDMKYFKAVNEIYGKYFTKPFPARETIAVKNLPKDVNVEISAIAICN